MNLADALRRVNSEGQPLPKPEPAKKTVEPVKISQPFVSPDLPEPEDVDSAQAPQSSNPNVSGNIVRLELFLSAEQMGGMFRAIMAGQHTILTAREAAAYLRISQESLIKLAEDGELPGVLIEGRWRFPKPNLDDWMTMQSVGPDDSEEIA